MSSLPQLALGFASSTPSEREVEQIKRSPTQHFGLSVSHHALFDALASEWLVPTGERGGHLLVRDAFLPPVDAEAGEAPHAITVRVRFELSAAPGCPVWVLREDEWVRLSICELEPSDRILWWPGSLSIHDVQGLEVGTLEARARLLGIARQVSNLSLPALEVSDPSYSSVTTPEPPSTEGEPAPSTAHDHMRGSAAMGWWALPRTGPWFEFIAASFSPGTERFHAALAALAAPWLEHLPWRPATAGPVSFDGVLWRAGVSVAASWSGRVSFALATAIVEAACAAAPEHADALHAWAKQTRAILRGEGELALETKGPVEGALQLVLARSTPERYRSWVRDRRNIPPAVWWSGALLVGLLCGYCELPSGFRGEPSLRRFLALRLSASQRCAGTVEWSPSAETVDIRIDGRIIDRKHQNARGLWYWAALDDAQTRAAALELCHTLGWSCGAHELRLANQALAVHGAGRLERVQQELRVVGEIRLTLPPGVELVPTLDEVAFRRCLVTRGGEIKRHPPRHGLPFRYSPAAPAPVRAREPKLDRQSLAVAELPGLLYLPEFVSEQEASELVEVIDASPWLDVLKRRVQHYGWKYDYKARKVTRDMQIGPLPTWAARVARQLHEASLLPWLADQVIVNEYCRNQGISKHVDCTPCFEEDIATISLVETWHMRFREKGTKRKIEQELERRSLAIMTGAARYDWTHEIPRRKKEPGGLVRQRRISLTFRKVKLADA